MTAMSLNTGHANKKQAPSGSTSSGGSSKRRAVSRLFVYDPDMGILKCVVSPDDIPFTALDNDWEAIVSQGIGVSLEAATFIIDHEREPDEAALLTPAPYDLPWWAASVRDEKHVLRRGKTSRQMTPPGAVPVSSPNENALFCQYILE